MRRDGEGYEYDDDHRFAYMDEDYGDDDDLDFICGLGPDGQCALAGSEDCDWDCPNSHGPGYAGSEAWAKLHAAETPHRELRLAKW